MGLKDKLPGIVLAFKILNYFILTFATLLGCIAHFDAENIATVRDTEVVPLPEFRFRQVSEKKVIVAVDSLGRPVDKKPSPENLFLLETVFVYFVIMAMMIMTVDLIYSRTSSGDKAIAMIDCMSHGLIAFLTLVAGALIVDSAVQMDYFVTNNYDIYYRLREGRDKEYADKLQSWERKHEYMYGEKIASGFFCFVSVLLSIFIAIMVYVNRNSGEKSDEPPATDDPAAQDPNAAAPAPAAPVSA